ncbi:MAG: sensor histidine kinase [Firmicutes bacterium]|nr:sensor histidine kinase [Bacillota bacterium]
MIRGDFGGKPFPLWVLACLKTIRALLRGSLRLIGKKEYEAGYGQDKPLLTLPLQKKEDVSAARSQVDRYLTELVPRWKTAAGKRALVALSEAITNVILHTPGGQVLLFLDEGTPRFHVIDQGPGLRFWQLPSILFTRGYSGRGSLGAGFPVMMGCLKRIVVCTSKEGTKLILYPDLDPKGKGSGF